MATAKESHTCQQFTARNSSYLDHMALPHLDKNFSLPYLPHYKCTANLAFPGQYASDLHSLNTGQQDAVCGFLKPLPTYCNTSYPTGSPYLKDSQCALSCGIGVVDKPVGASIPPPRRFLIFDQSDNHTRLFFSPSFSPDDQVFPYKTHVSANGLFEKAATQLDQHLTNPTVEEKWDENHLSDGEGDMLEDSEEINALLYSDSDDDNDSENDEVTSTGHTPPLSLEEGNCRYKSLHEVSSCDESRKRQRLLDGKYKKQSLESGDACSYEDDIDSNKVKIREALKMLESMIPGMDNKDPVSIIDGAVAYLKSMKAEAESLGLSSI